MRLLNLLLVGSVIASPVLAADSTHLPLAELASANQARLAALSIGMSKDEVIGVMGKATADTRNGIVNNPWSVEACSDADQSPLEILFYVTRKNQPFTPVRKSLTTAVVLRAGKVIAWGESVGDRCK